MRPRPTIVLSPEAWAAEWKKTDSHDPQLTRSLNGFAELCNRVSAERYERYPGVNFSNARYECHLERSLEAGLNVPDAYIAVVTDRELRFDGYAFPLLNARRAALKRDHS